MYSIEYHRPWSDKKESSTIASAGALLNLQMWFKRWYKETKEVILEHLFLYIHVLFCKHYNIINIL